MHTLGATCAHMHTCAMYAHASSPTYSCEWKCISPYCKRGGAGRASARSWIRLTIPFVIISFEPYVTDSIIKGTLHHFSTLSPDWMLLVDVN